MRGGLSIDDVMPSVALSLISVVVIFVVSFIAANVVAFWEPPRVEGDTINSRVRMWVVSLMIGTAAAYFLFALSLAITHYAVAYRGADLYGDLITDSIIRLLGGLGVSADKIDSLGLILQSISNVTYVFLALLLIFFAHRLLRRKIVDVREPNILTVGIIVTIVMTVTNWIAMMD